MSWRHCCCWVGVIAVGFSLTVTGCDYSAKKSSVKSLDSYVGPLPNQPRRASSAVFEDNNSETPRNEGDSELAKRREVILANVVNLMKLAYDHPGGRNFEMATENLNELFEFGAKPADYAQTKPSHDFLVQKIHDLTGQDPEPILKSLSAPKFTIRDARHIEDCMLYRSVALRVAGEGDDLTRVRRIFDWTIRNVQLVPAESLAVGQYRQAQARPADVLFRGMATESGFWSERGWVFMSLCRQIGVDVGILSYSPRRPTMGLNAADTSAAPTISWITAAIVNDKPYLFDPRIGLEIPDLDGTGVATLIDAIVHPEILDRLDLPGESSLGTTAADLANSPTKIGVVVDSSIGYMSPRMRLLQGQLRGENRTILFRDPAEQARHFAQALGSRFGGITLWNLPIQIEELLFTSPEFVAATQASLQFFDGKYPLLAARTKQLRGDLVEATNQYVAFRFAENPEISPEAQRGLDIYATYFLGLNHLDRGNTDQAEYLFRKMLDMVPDPGPGRYFYYMLRWGALNNLGRIAEQKGNMSAAVAYYGAADSSNGYATPQRHGDLVRARRLVWKNPISDPPAALAPAPVDLTNTTPSQPKIPDSIAAP